MRSDSLTAGDTDEGAVFVEAGKRTSRAARETVVQRLVLHIPVSRKQQSADGEVGDDAEEISSLISLRLLRCCSRLYVLPSSVP